MASQTPEYLSYLKHTMVPTISKNMEKERKFEDCIILIPKGEFKTDTLNQIIFTCRDITFLYL